MSVRQDQCTVCGQHKPGPAPQLRPGEPPPRFVCSDCLRDQPRITELRHLLRSEGWEVGGPETTDGAFWRAGGIRIGGERTDAGPAGSGDSPLHAVEDLYWQIMREDPPAM